MTAKAVLLERRRMRRNGFRGRAGRVLWSARDSRSHSLRVVLYSFRRGPDQPYAEVWESHDRARRARIVPLADLVHVVQNLGSDELVEVASRRRPGAPRSRHGGEASPRR